MKRGWRIIERAERMSFTPSFSVIVLKDSGGFSANTDEFDTALECCDVSEEAEEGVIVDKVGSEVPVVLEENWDQEDLLLESHEDTHCLICFTSIKEECHSGSSGQRKLNALCQCLKASKVLEESNLEDSRWKNQLFYCKSCDQQIEQVSSILDQLQDLNSRLQEFEARFKRTIISTFQDGSRSWANLFRKSLLNSCKNGAPSADQVPGVSDAQTEKSVSTQDREVDEELIIIGSPRPKVSLPVKGSSKLKCWRDKEASQISSRSGKSLACPSGRTFKCHICRRSFISQAIRTAHIKKYHQGQKKPYECEECQHKYEKPSQLLAHQDRWHSPSNDISSCHPCGKCSKMFKSEEALHAHELRFHQGVPKPYKCLRCSKTFRHKLHLDEHAFFQPSCSTSASTLFKCHTCDQSFPSQRKLRLHAADAHHQHSSPAPFPCEKCPAEFPTINMLENHCRTKHFPRDQSRCICEVCGQSYSSVRRLKVHFKLHEQPQIAPVLFNCPQCDKTFKDRSSLKVHISSVHEKTFKHRCETCGQGAQTASMLKRHMLCHSTEKKFSCNICEKHFKRKPQLLQHQLWHQGKCPFVCKDCGKGFRASEKLKNHEKLHLGEKPFSCEICGKAYALKHYLTNHVNTAHRGMKPRRSGSGPRREGHSTTRVKTLVQSSVSDRTVGISSIVSSEITQTAVVPPTRDGNEKIISAQNNVPGEIPNTSISGYQWIHLGFVAAVPKPL